MKQENNMYYAEPGKLIFRKSDDFIMGDGICLWIEDNIDNYEERDVTEDEMNAFYESVGLKRNNKTSWVNNIENESNSKNLLMGTNNTENSFVDIHKKWL